MDQRQKQVFVVMYMLRFTFWLGVSLSDSYNKKLKFVWLGSLLQTKRWYDTVDGRNPAPVNRQFIKNIYKVVTHPRWLFGISSINSIPPGEIRKNHRLKHAKIWGVIMLVPIPPDLSINPRAAKRPHLRLQCSDSRAYSLSLRLMWLQLLMGCLEILLQ